MLNARELGDPLDVLLGLGEHGFVVQEHDVLGIGVGRLPPLQNVVEPRPVDMPGLKQIAAPRLLATGHVAGDAYHVHHVEVRAFR